MGPQEVKKTHQRRVVVIAVPTGFVPDIAGAQGVANLAVSNARINDAKGRFTIQADVMASAKDTKNVFTADILARNPGRIARCGEFSCQDVPKVRTRIPLAQDERRALEIGPVGDIVVRESMVLWQGNDDAFGPQRQRWPFMFLRLSRDDGHVNAAASDP